MQVQALHLDAGADGRRSLEALAQQQNAQGFVLGVVGNLSQACFACPGRTSPTQLSGELIGGYSELAELHGTGGLDALRHG